MDTDSFINHIKTKDDYKDIADDVEKDLIRQIMKSIDHCLQEKLKKLTGTMKDELGEKIITKLVAVRQKIDSYLIDHENSDKNAIGTTMCNKTNNQV